MRSRDAQQRKHQISASTPFAAKPRTFNVAAVASLLARVSIPSLMLFLGLAKIYGLCFWEWIACLILFVWICMDQYGSVWCLTRTLWTNRETMWNTSSGATGQPIQRSAENGPNMSLQGFSMVLWCSLPCHFDPFRSISAKALTVEALDVADTGLSSPLDTGAEQAGDATHFGYSQCQCWRVMKGYEGLWRVMKGWNAGWATLNTSCYSAPFCSGSTLHTWNRLLFKMCPESKRRCCRFWWRCVFLTSVQCIVGCFLKSTESTEVQHTFAVFSDLQRNASQPERKHGKLGKSVQPNLDSTCFKYRGNFHAWPGSLKHVETCWNWQSDT